MQRIVVFGAVLALSLSSPPANAQDDGTTFKPDELPASWPTAASNTRETPSKNANTGRTAVLLKALKDPRLTLFKVSRAFLPGRAGSAPKLVDATDAWLVLKDGRITEFLKEPTSPVKIREDQVKAKLVDLAKDWPSSFAMPGICDADSRWFRIRREYADTGANEAVRAAEDLETWQKGWRDVLRQGGVTTLFVPASQVSRTSGPGALLALDTGNGVTVESKDGALFFRAATLKTRGNSLSRASVAKALDSAMDAATKYEKARKKWKKDVAEYKKKRKAFLAYYKLHPMKKGDANDAATPRPRRSGRRFRPTRAQMMMLMKLPPAERGAAIAKLRAAAQGGAKKPTTGKKTAAKKNTAGKAPPRPKWPKQPAVSRAKEALLEVLHGKRALRIEAHRAAEIRAILKVTQDNSIDKIAIVGATEAWKVAKELRVAGASVVLRPESVPTRGIDALEDHMATNAARLAREGVPVAFGSAGTWRARWLPLLAARAVAEGMSEAQALQGLTQNALDSAGLGNAKTGLVVFTGSPLSSTSRVLCVAREHVQMIGDSK